MISLEIEKLFGPHEHGALSKKGGGVLKTLKIKTSMTRNYLR